jgi:methionine synthase I (cobalamin-dependent)/5,10-methylenetetrahydrofolate reductase
MAAQAEPLIERLARGPLLCDGAMGTLLFARLGTTQATICFDELNRAQPDLVQGIHLEYILAGAEAIETNTFGANAVKLGHYGLAEHVREINRRGAQLAREAREVAGRSIFVLGSIGPTGLPLSGVSDERLAEMCAVFQDQVDGLVKGGVDALVLETFANVAELRQAALAARAVCDLPIIAQITFSDDGQTTVGQSPAEAVALLADLDLAVIGANCGMGPAGTLDVIAAMADALDHLPAGAARPYLSAQPNAGLPARVEGRFFYVSTPEYFADYAHRFLDAGVRLLGGCCGTTPRHIAAMHEAIATPAATVSAPAVIAETPAPHLVPDDDSLLPQPGTPTRWQAALEAGRFAVSVELDPPKGLSPAKVLAGAELLRARGVEFINIADSPTARVHMSCIALARLLRDALDVETIVHFTTRDRNLMALQSDLLGAHALGLRNVLALTGDPLRANDYPNLTGVWNIDSVGLVRVLRGMNEGHDAGGAPLGGKASFFIGAALDVNVGAAQIDSTVERARNKLPDGAPMLTEQELEFSRYQAKLEAGAHFIMTQFIYDLAPLRAFHQRFGPPRVPLILGLSPLYSFKHAEFLHNEVRGITIPLEVRERMRAAGKRGRDVGVEIAFELITAARREGLIQGCYLLPSYGRYDLVADLASALLADEPVEPSHAIL